MMAENSACYYALHIGCLYLNDPHCRNCAEALKNAVNQIPRPIAEKN